MTFYVRATRYSFSADAAPRTNVLRGALGATLHQTDELYSKWFDPQWQGGPSGYRNAPRPFVLRSRGGSAELVVFAKRTQLEQEFTGALRGAEGIGEVAVTAQEEIFLPLNEQDGEGLLRIEFATPTELKSSGRVAMIPEFAVLTARLAERVQALGICYQQWPTDFNFRDLLENASKVTLRAHCWEPAAGERRRSARSGQIHELRGSTGWAEYEGRVGPFLPLLGIGEWTGVGRSTVWGHGQIRIAERR